MREKLETLSLVQLKDLAKAEGFKGISGMKKADLVELLASHAEKKDEHKETQKDETADRKAAQSESGMRESESRAEQPGGRESESRTKQSGRRESAGSTEQPGRQEDRQGNRSESKQESKPDNRQDNKTDNRQNNRQENRNRQERQRGQAVRNGRVQGSSRDGQNIRQNPQTNQPRQKVADTEVIKASELDSGETASGILEIMQDGFGFIRSDNFLPGEEDVYVAPSQIRKFDLRTGDVITGSKRVRSAAEKFAALLYVKSINGQPADSMPRRRKFENLTPIFPNKRIHLETAPDSAVAVRIVDIISPIGKGQRGMIVSPPKAGKTTLLKQIAKAVKKNDPDMHIIILLIDERPEEVTDMKEEVEGPSVEVIYSTFDEQPEQHKRVSEMVIERAKRLVEQGKDVMILLDSITRLARAYNLTVTPSGRTLSGGLDPAALYMPKRFFGAARNLREGGSLTILATALIDTGSRLDDMVFEEFKGTGNMELVLDRKMSERRLFPAIDILKSGTRRDDLLLSVQEQDATNIIHKMISTSKPEETAEVIIDLFGKTRTNREFIERLRMYRR